MKASIVASILATLLLACLASVASADGNGSPGDCLGGPSVADDTYTAPDGFVVDGLCIKAGQLHTDVVTGDQSGCYSIDGIGSPTVTVTQDFDGPDCQDVSHIDLILSICSTECDPPPPPPDCDPEVELCDPPTDPCELDPESCDPLGLICVDGDVVEAPAGAATNDCDPARICVDGESLTVTEFEAAQIENADDGSCTPTELPPPPTPETPAPTTTVQEVAGVQEVGPTQEVAALPSAGYGDTAGASHLWLVLMGGLTLLMGLTLGTLMAARSRG